MPTSMVKANLCSKSRGKTRRICTFSVYSNRRRELPEVAEHAGLDSSPNGDCSEPAF